MLRELNDVLHEGRIEICTGLNSSRMFDRPADVARDPGLTLDEKRAILASWASDACAVNSAPALRRIPNGNVVSYDDVVDALRSLDAELAETSRVGPRSVCSNEPGGASDGQTRRSLQ